MEIWGRGVGRDIAAGSMDAPAQSAWRGRCEPLHSSLRGECERERRDRSAMPVEEVQPQDTQLEQAVTRNRRGYASAAPGSGAQLAVGDRGASLQARKVLIIEHAEVLAENLQAHFHRCGWDARIACNGKLAVIAASEFRPELILIDYNLPDMSAFEALDAIRVGHCCSCVLMTGPPDDIVVADAQRRGISRILSKPFVLAELQSLLLASATEFCSKCIEN